MTEAFARKGLDAPRLSAELLLSHVLRCEKLRLYMDADRPASPLERQALRDLVARALRHEPIQYLVGQWWFFGLPFTVDRRVLIPRPATETIVGHVLQHWRARHAHGSRAAADGGVGGGAGLLLADIGTGSGCIAIALLKNLPQARALATDISPEALAVARQNAERHAVAPRIDFLAGHLLDPLREHPASRSAGSLDYLVSNPPYIPDDEWAAVAPNVRDHEPHGALRGGQDGLAFVRPLIESGPEFIRPSGLLLVEVAESRADEALRIAAAHPALQDAAILADAEGRPRVVVAHKRA